MKKLLSLGLVLSIVLLAAGCAAAEPEAGPTPSPSAKPTPSTKPSPEPTESAPVYTRDMVFDENGEPILGEYGLENISAAVSCIKEFTTEEVMKLAPYADGALATAVDLTLAKHLLKNFDETLAAIAAADPTAFHGGQEHFESTCFGIGYEIWLDLNDGIISEEDCAVIFAQHNLTYTEQTVLDKIIEGFNRAENDQNIVQSQSGQ